MTKYDVGAVVNNNEEYLDSREVAHMVNKRHDHLIRDIQEYIKDLEYNPDLGATNFFVESSYKGAQNKEFSSLFHPKEELLAHYNNDTLKGSN